MTNIAEAPAPTKIVFGTDGWRARIADEYTFENVRRCADGVARYVVDRGEQAKGVVIAYDRRFASEHFATAAAEVLLAHDIPVAFASHAVPTQMSSYEVVERGAAAGIVITASHNPWTDNGFKVKAPTGSAAGPEILAVLEAAIAQPTAARRSSAGRSTTPRRPGWSSGSTRSRATSATLRRTVDIDALRAADVAVLVEPMWGAGAGWISRLLGGGRIRVTEIHQERNPYFGGVNPEPIRPNVDEALGMLARGGYDLGLMLDGDADRAGAADEKGTFIHQLEVTGLLMYYLPSTAGCATRSSISVNNTSMAAPARRALRDRDLRDLGRVQVHRPEDDRDRGDDGRRGVGRLRLRDAPARARRDLRRPAPARPVPAREGRRTLAGLEGAGAPSTSSPGRRSTGGSTSTSTGPPTRRSRTGCSSSCGRTRRPSSPARRSRRPRRSTRTTASSSASPTARGCSSGFSGTEPLVRVYTEATLARRPRGDDRRRRATGPRRMTDGTAAGRDRIAPDPLDDDARRADLDPGDMAGGDRDARRPAPRRRRAAPDDRGPARARAVAERGGPRDGRLGDGRRPAPGAFADRARLPIVVSREPELPAWVGAVDPGHRLVALGRHRRDAGRDARRDRARGGDRRGHLRRRDGGARRRPRDARRDLAGRPAAGRARRVGRARPRRARRGGRRRPHVRADRAARRGRGVRPGHRAASGPGSPPPPTRPSSVARCSRAGSPSWSAAGTWPRSPGAGRPSSTRTPRPGRPGTSCPSWPTTRSSGSTPRRSFATRST